MSILDGHVVSLSRFESVGTCLTISEHIEAIWK